MTRIPRDRRTDSTLALAREGYDFTENRRREQNTEIFETRLMMRKAICIRGEQAAQVFYNTALFERNGVTPGRINKTLFGEGGVQGLDDEDHRWRKQMFMSLMTPSRLDALSDLVNQRWTEALESWQSERDEIILFDEVEKILFLAICDWCGVPLDSTDVNQRTADTSLMIAGTGAVGPTHWRARRARRRSENWIKDIVKQVRKRKLTTPEGSALHIIAFHRNTNGKLLNTDSAVVDLLNVIRPTVAVARFIIFAALALHEHPQYRRTFQDGDDQEMEYFVQEVRRYYPFFPFQMARVRRAFEWQGYRFPKGRLVLLDLYGTNHDPASWDNPHEFRPERFRDWDGSAFDFVPQGGGDHYGGHRCPGEWITIDIMKAAIRRLVQTMDYDVPEQDLAIDRTKMPTAPESRFIISNVRRR